MFGSILFKRKSTKRKRRYDVFDCSLYAIEIDQSVCDLMPLDRVRGEERLGFHSADNKDGGHVGG